MTADGDGAWYWGVVVRVDAADAALHALAALELPDGVAPQRPGTGHVTLLYAPLRGAEDHERLARTSLPVAASLAPFRLRLAGFSEFATPTRVVGWIGVGGDDGAVDSVRQALASREEDALAHPFVPHLTVAHGDDPRAYGTVRDPIRRVVEGLTVDVLVDELWIAGFPAGGHPARDLVYRHCLPLRAAAPAPIGVGDCA